MIVITTLSEEEEIFLLEVIRKLIINITFSLCKCDFREILHGKQLNNVNRAIRRTIGGLQNSHSDV